MRRNPMKLYLVGGAVRNHLLGVTRSKDFDFAVEAESFEQMKDELHYRYGVTVWQTRPEFVCVRGRVNLDMLGEFGGLLATPQGFSRHRVFVDADFTLCRAEAMYSDLRHPDKVTPADLRTDLSRRDFTMNAVAMSENGTLVDPFGGVHDAKMQRLRCVGNPRERFEEDPLRILRALRFVVKYKLSWGSALSNALRDEFMVQKVSTLPVERVREELVKALSADWYLTMVYLVNDFRELAAVLRESFPSLWIKATTEEK